MPTKGRITLKVNGAVTQIEVAPWTTLLDTLREHLDLTGTKKGCDHLQCGACTSAAITVIRGDSPDRKEDVEWPTMELVLKATRSVWDLPGSFGDGREKRRPKMDCSDRYVQMSRKAEEIQRLWAPAEGDLFVDELCHVSMVSRPILDHLNKCFTQEKRENYIWLPRQDQLQEMVLSTFEGNCYWMLEECYKFITFPPYSLQLESMEQIWLAFIMKEKNGKIWSSEDWKEMRK